MLPLGLLRLYCWGTTVSRDRLTTTSYALLGLLAVQPWSTYELTRQMDRSLGRIWPRASSKLYEEPKKLVALGLAGARSEHVGDRPRTVYAITTAGRAALAQWLARPPAGPVLEAEHLVKLLFAEHGTRDDALAGLAAARQWAQERNEDNAATALGHLEGTAPFPERLPQTMLVAGFLTEFYRLVAEWSDWAGELVEQWPEDPAQAEPDRNALEQVARRARW